MGTALGGGEVNEVRRVIKRAGRPIYAPTVDSSSTLSALR